MTLDSIHNSCDDLQSLLLGELLRWPLLVNDDCQVVVILIQGGGVHLETWGALPVRTQMVLFPSDQNWSSFDWFPGWLWGFYLPPHHWQSLNSPRQPLDFDLDPGAHVYLETWGALTSLHPESSFLTIGPPWCSWPRGEGVHLETWGARPERWIVTIPSFDQWLATIEKPSSPMVARPKTIAKPSSPMVARLKKHRGQWLIDQKPLKKIGTNGFFQTIHSMAMVTLKTIDVSQW